MKKYKLIVNILLLGIFIISIIVFGLLISTCKNHHNAYIHYTEIINMFENDSTRYNHYKEVSEKYLSLFLQSLFAIIFSALSAIATGTILIVINLNDAKNAIFKQSQLTAERRAAKKQAQAERAEADKQKAIAEKQQQLERLQSELEELKND